MTKKVNGEMIALAREARGMNQRALAEMVSLAQGTISRYERGWVEMPDEHLFALANALERPPSFFLWDERRYGASCMYHRRRQKISQRELRMIQAQVDLVRMQSARLLKYTEVEATYAFHRLDMHKLGSSQEAARRLRALWQMPMGAVRNVVDSVESAGGVVYRCRFGTKNVDGVSQWPQATPDLPPVFFINDEFPGDRQRWTLAHEIGHMVLHHLPTDDPEKEANLFAGEFLMPADEIGPDLENPTLPKIAALKSYWKVSMAAIIWWGREIGRISQDQYEYLFKQLSFRGYRLCEPVPVPPEEPRLFDEMRTVLCKATKKTEGELSEYLGLPIDEYRSDYLRGYPHLKLVG